MTEHYFSEKPQSALRLYSLTFSFFGHSLELYTASGLFAVKKVDKGSILLLSCAKSLLHGKEKVLDLGCGYGVLGLSIQKIFPTIDLTLSDVNERAVEITKKNLERNHLKAKLVQSFSFEKIPEEFDLVLLNPPQTAGRELCIQLMKDAFEHLGKKASLLIVARHNKGGRTLSAYLEEIFGNVECLGKQGGYRVYRGIKR